MTRTLPQYLLPLEPQYRERVWGGQKLRQADPPVGEAWIAFEESRVSRGECAGLTVGELSERHGALLVGEDVARRFGPRLPLLIKLLDCADWLSVQVHPNDEQAERLVGPGHYGKTEAWHFLEVDEGATILAGVKPGTARAELARAIREGRVLDVTVKQEVHEGDTVFIPAGTLHALGPGMLLYEVQQLSDTTYRVYDWDRPASAGRQLHVEESVEVTNPELTSTVTPTPTMSGTGVHTAVTCPYFTLTLLNVDGTLAADTRSLSAHVLTAVGGDVDVVRGAETVRLGRYESLLVAGSAGAYEVRSANGAARVLCADVPTPSA